LIVDTARHYHRKIVVGVASYLHEADDWSLYVEEDPHERLPDFRNYRADGVISTFHDQKISTTISQLKIPIVGIEGDYGWREPNSRIPYFATDNEAIGRMGAQDLIERGFRQLAFCGVPSKRMTGWSHERASAFEQAAREAEIPCSSFVGRYSTARKWSEVQRELATWLATLKTPVGLMACNDIRARHVLEACREIGVRVPEDVSVIGVDNDEMMCELTTPPLSSIEQGARGLGYQAAELLDRMMAGEKPEQIRFFVEPERVVTRRSSDILAFEDADVEAAMRFIQENACDGISVPGVVSSVDVSRSTLEVKFKTIMHRTIHTEIQRVQLQRAMQLAATTDLPLKQVATQSGFSSVQYMTTVFRKSTGQTPHEYRRRSHT